MSRSPFSTPPNRSASHKRKRARVRCQECDACQRDDCGTCVNCLKKKKFGGDGSCKEACVRRKCGNLRERSAHGRHSSGPLSISDTNEDEEDDFWWGRFVEEGENSTADETTQNLVNHDLIKSPPWPSSRRETRSHNPIEKSSSDNRCVEKKNTTLPNRCAEKKNTTLPNRCVEKKNTTLPNRSVEKKNTTVPNRAVEKKNITLLNRSVEKKNNTLPKKISNTARSRSPPEDIPPVQSKIQPRNWAKQESKEILYGKCNPSYTAEQCAGCLGKRTKELEHDPILICDGCEREFHLDCCLPPLVEVPPGIYYCLDCSEKGTTACLEQYFEDHHEKRAEYASSLEFVTALLEKMIAEEDDRVCRIPQSELARLSKLHFDALTLSARYLTCSKLSCPGTTLRSQSVVTGRKSRDKLGPGFLLGKCLRLYCPIGNQYHSGRIISWRTVSHCDKFWASDVADAEFLVRFSSGKDYRKKAYRQWVILEEHALAIGATLIWGMNFPRKGILGWNPAQTWLRTSLELLPVQAELSHDQNQIYYGTDAVSPDHNPWALATFWGEDLHVLMELRDEAVDYFSVSFADARYQRHLTMSHTDVQLDVYMGLAQVEWEEQQHVRSWQRLPLNDPVHCSVLRLQDESSLEPCSQHERDPRLCHSIQIDYDRLHLLHKISPSPTLDMGSSMVCELVAPSPQIITQFEEQEH